MALKASVGVASDVRGPFVLRGVGVAGSDILVLEGFELLLGAEFVGLTRISNDLDQVEDEYIP
jgi:hypothetical protein